MSAKQLITYSRREVYRMCTEFNWVYRVRKATSDLSVLVFFYWTSLDLTFVRNKNQFTIT